MESDLRTAKENASIKYSFYVKNFSSAQYTSVHQSFTLASKHTGDLKLRCRAVGRYTNAGTALAAAPSAYIGFVNHAWRACYIDIYEGFGSEEKFFEALNGGALLVTDKADTWMSPIAEAFKQAESIGVTDLFHTGYKHPNLKGAYLKACVNYLMVFGEAFDANVPDCQIDAVTAKKLRDVAESVVLGKLDSYRNPDSSNVTPGGDGVVPGGGDMDPDAVVQGENGIKTADQFISFAYVFNNGGDYTIKGLQLNVLDNEKNVMGLFGACATASDHSSQVVGCSVSGAITI